MVGMDVDVVVGGLTQAHCRAASMHVVERLLRLAMRVVNASLEDACHGHMLCLCMQGCYVYVVDVSM